MMPQKPRRINDAQVERLLANMRDVSYRRALTIALLKREGVKQFTPTGRTTAEHKRRYASTMRRFQRYTTSAGEKRSFARAPIAYQRPVRAVARVLPAPRQLPAPKAVRQYDEATEYERERSLRGFQLEPDRAPSDVDFYEPSSNAILRAMRAYYDGDVPEAADAMRLSQRGERLLELATDGEGVSITSMRGAGEVYDQVRETLEGLPYSDVSDIQDFHDLLQNLPDWQIGMILADLEDENTTFADWLDAWRDDGMTLDANESEYWALWRAAYARAKA